MRGSTGKAEVEDVEGRRLSTRGGFSVASLMSDWRKARKRERLYVGGYVCVSSPLGGVVLAAWVSDWTEYIQVTHSPAMDHELRVSRLRCWYVRGPPAVIEHDGLVVMKATGVLFSGERGEMSNWSDPRTRYLWCFLVSPTWNSCLEKRGNEVHKDSRSISRTRNRMVRRQSPRKICASQTPPKSKNLWSNVSCPSIEDKTLDIRFWGLYYTIYSFRRARFYFREWRK